MKKIIITAFIAISFIFAGCGDKFLDTKNLYQKDLDNYYKNPTDIAEALTGAYSCLAVDGGANHPILISNIMGDDCYSGGGTNDIQTIGTDKFENPTEDMYLGIYDRCYQGIFRCNTLIERFPQAVYTDAVAQKQDLGEAYFLRALFYFRLAQIFGEVPLDLSPGLDYLPKATAPEIYAQIASDLKAAIENMDGKTYDQIDPARRGHATKWAAEALMARVYLFYTGFYTQSSLPLKSGSIDKAQVVTWIEDCIANSKHGLVASFASIWPASILNSVDDKEYPYATSDKWVRDGSKETVFAVKYSPNGDWGNTGRLAYCNQYVLYTSVRAKDYPPFGTGWGIGDVSTQLKAAFDLDGDKRKTATIIDNTDVNEGVIASAYEWGGWNCANETGLWNKKYTSVIRDLADPTTGTGAGDGTYSGMFYFIYKGTNNMQLWNMQDDILIRFSDVLLMAAELGSNSQKYLDMVRTRAGMPTVAYTLAALKHERQVELALEGLRWYDLLRWGDAQAAINAANGTPVKTDKVDVKYQVTFNANRVFAKLPESQIRVSQGKLVQNPGW